MIKKATKKKVLLRVRLKFPKTARLKYFKINSPDSMLKKEIILLRKKRLKYFKFSISFFDSRETNYFPS